MRKRYRLQFSHTKPRVEKKLSESARQLLLALFPGMDRDDFHLDVSPFNTYRGEQWREGWYSADDEEAFDLLKRTLENQSHPTNIPGGRGYGAAWFFKWRKASRREIIRHARQQVKAGQIWGRG